LYEKGAPFFTPKIYENVGKQLVVSILDIFEKNPVSRIPFTKYENINKIRSEVVYEIAKYDRFGRNGNILQKIEDLHSMVDKHFNKKFRDRIFRAKTPLLMPPQISSIPNIRIKSKRSNFFLP